MVLILVLTATNSILVVGLGFSRGIERLPLDGPGKGGEWG
jgi:hypothetical protein